MLVFTMILKQKTLIMFHCDFYINILKSKQPQKSKYFKKNQFIFIYKKVYQSGKNKEKHIKTYKNLYEKKDMRLTYSESPDKKYNRIKISISKSYKVVKKNIYL